MNGKKIFTLEEDAPKLCALLNNSPTTLRILLKTKNDDLLIEKWIKHYSAIVDKPTDIIIFDNCSTNKDVLEIYEKYSDVVTIVKFSCYFNDLHDIRKIPHIYQAIFNSSKFYTFVDTDEFLYLYDNNKAIADNRIVALLDNSQNISFFPTFWLKNDLFRQDVFVFKRDIDYMRYLAAMGKPILNTNTARQHFHKTIIHALQMPVAVYGNAPCRFLLFHLSTVSKSHRINININKLVQYGIIKNANDFQTIMTIDIDRIRHGNLRYFVSEIRRLLAMPDTIDDNIGPEHVALLPDGSLQFYPPTMKKFFDKFANKDSSFFELLDIDPTAKAKENTTIWELYDNETYSKDIAPQMRWEN